MVYSPFYYSLFVDNYIYYRRNPLYTSKLQKKSLALTLRRRFHYFISYAAEYSVAIIYLIEPQVTFLLDIRSQAYNSGPI